MPLEERVKQNFDHPDSMDTPLMAEHVRRLREGQAIERPRTISRIFGAQMRPSDSSRARQSSSKGF